MSEREVFIYFQFQKTRAWAGLILGFNKWVYSGVSDQFQVANQGLGGSQRAPTALSNIESDNVITLDESSPIIPQVEKKYCPDPHGSHHLSVRRTPNQGIW